MRWPVAVIILCAKRMDPKSEMYDLIMEFAVLRRADIHDTESTLHTLDAFSSFPLAAIMLEF